MLKMVAPGVTVALLLCASNTGAGEAVDRVEAEHLSASPTEQKTEGQHSIPNSERHGRRSATSPGTHTDYERAWAERIEQTWRTYFRDGLPPRDVPIAAVVDMAIGSDGTLRDVKVLQTSGDSEIDAAVLQAVHLSAPFALFPPSLKTEVDVLHIMRTWRIPVSGELDLRVDAADAEAWLKLFVIPPPSDLKEPQRRSMGIVHLNASLGEQLEITAKRPRPKYLTGASSKEYKYASYMADWERKIEAVGSVNFPDEARRRNLQGDLLLDVAINPDGSIVDVVIRRSSGNKLVDDAALRIVYLAAPFAPFPPSFLENFTVLHITRTWRFSPDGKVETE